MDTKTSKQPVITRVGFRCLRCGVLDANSNQPCAEHSEVEEVFRLEEATPASLYRPSGFGEGVVTRLEAVVTDATFVLGGVHAMVKLGASAPMLVRFTYEQALAADIIEKVE